MADVDVDFGNKTAVVTMQPGRTLTRSDCEKAFGESRYKVLSFEARTDAAGAPPGS